MQHFAIFAYLTTGFLFVLAVILEKLSEWKRLSSKWRDKIDDYRIGPSLLFFFSIPISVAALILTHTEQIYNTISSYWFFPPAVVVGLVLFFFRCRAPFWYGSVEVLASWVMIWIAIIAPTGSLPTDKGEAASFGIPMLAKTTTLLAGIYVSVRGLDNIDKDPPVRFGGLWGKVFRKKTVCVTPVA